MFPGTWLTKPRAFSDLHPVFDRIFEDFFRDFSRATQAPYPRINVSEDAETLIVTAEVPGIDPESLDVKVQGDTLAFSGTKRPVVEGSNGRLLRNERGHGSFSREISLPVKVASDDVRATYELGILTITMPKAPEAKPRLIKVQAK